MRAVRAPARPRIRRHGCPAVSGSKRIGCAAVPSATSVPPASTFPSVRRAHAHDGARCDRSVAPVRTEMSSGIRCTPAAHVSSAVIVDAWCSVIAPVSTGHALGGGASVPASADGGIGWHAASATTTSVGARVSRVRSAKRMRVPPRGCGMVRAAVTQHRLLLPDRRERACAVRHARGRVRRRANASPASAPSAPNARGVPRSRAGVAHTHRNRRPAARTHRRRRRRTAMSRRALASTAPSLEPSSPASPPSTSGTAAISRERLSLAPLYLSVHDSIAWSNWSASAR